VTTWLLLRGLTRETRHWGNFADELRAQIDDANVIAVDLSGNGSLHQQSSPRTVEEMAEHCRAEMQRRGIAAPYNIVAMSLGAMVTVAWAARYPQEIKRCVLVNTSMRPFNAFYQRLRPANYAALLRLALFGGTPAAWESTILRITSSDVPAHANVLKDWASYRQQFPVSRANALRQLIAAARFRAPAQKPATDMLLLSSTRDALVDTRCSQAVAASWQVPIALHPDAGHDLPLDDPQWVARQIRDWLEST
jgi:pimeloyl-ACP methyl ester carboxylesterase